MPTIDRGYREIVAHYEDCLARHGDNHRGVDWPRARDALLRYAVMLGVIPEAAPRPVRLLDFGCGAGHLLDFIRRRRLRGIEYHGLDVSDQFVKLCRRKFPRASFVQADVLDGGASIEVFDYIIMNGVFTEKRGLSAARMWRYVQAVLKKLWPHAQGGMAFNVMSQQVRLAPRRLISFVGRRPDGFPQGRAVAALHDSPGLRALRVHGVRLPGAQPMNRVIIFGLQDFASLAHFYLREDSEFEVSAFTVSKDYLPAEPVFEGKPVVAFEELEQHFAPQEYHLFAPMSPRGMNRVRAAIYREGKVRGYRFISYVSSRATVFRGTPIGENCFILEDNTIQPFTWIGDNVILWSGNHVGHHTTIGDHVMLSSHVVVSGHCAIEPHCFLGVNATIRDGTRLGEGTLVAMGACIGRDTEAWSVYQGNPARKRDVASTDVEL